MWIAREKSGSLWIHENEPHFDGYEWMSDGEYSEISDSWFPEVTFTTGPVKVVLKIKE